MELICIVNKKGLKALKNFIQMASIDPNDTKIAIFPIAHKIGQGWRLRSQTLMAYEDWRLCLLTYVDQ